MKISKTNIFIPDLLQLHVLFFVAHCKLKALRGTRRLGVPRGFNMDQYEGTLQGAIFAPRRKSKNSFLSPRDLKK